MQYAVKISKIHVPVLVDFKWENSIQVYCLMPAVATYHFCANAFHRLMGTLAFKIT